MSSEKLKTISVARTTPVGSSVGLSDIWVGGLKSTSKLSFSLSVDLIKSYIPPISAHHVAVAFIPIRLLSSLNNGLPELLSYCSENGS